MLYLNHCIHKTIPNLIIYNDFSSILQCIDMYSDGCDPLWTSALSQQTNGKKALQIHSNSHTKKSFH